jgi:hypothetical protein
MTAIRFGVGSAEGSRSSLWRVWTGKKTSDVYVESRDVHGVMKFSLHESGDWHSGYRSEYVRAEMKAGRWRGEKTRWSEWKRPAEFAPGFTVALKFVVPREAVARTTAPLPTSKEILWTPTPPIGQAIVFTLTLASSGIQGDPFRKHHGSVQVGAMLLPNGESLLIHSHVVDGELARAVMLNSLTGFLENLWQVDTSDLPQFADDMTLLGFSTDPSGAEVVTECPLAVLRDAWLLEGAADDSTAAVSTKHPVGTIFIDVEVTAPPALFAAEGIDPTADPELAQTAFERWRDRKVAEIRRLLSR